MKILRKTVAIFALALILLFSAPVASYAGTAYGTAMTFSVSGINYLSDSYVTTGTNQAF